MDVAEVLVGDVGVDLRRLNICVPEERLDRAEVGAVLEEVGREGVTYDVRRDLLRDTSLNSVVLYEEFDRARGESPGLLLPAPVVYEERFFHIFSRLEVVRDRLLRRRRKKDDADFFTLTSNRHLVA